ncbi:probable indole-3-acetic acid-amido synthetase GH3.11 isoform X2 [Typha angustifolia]|uniref:probable indole-3-acetic acid-amido synthetase GH3.11 isoform X2 n=1 Tax=Typha angustifolia TaxID=59011 RepID=UPI003C2DD072
MSYGKRRRRAIQTGYNLFRRTAMVGVPKLLKHAVTSKKFIRSSILLQPHSTISHKPADSRTKLGMLLQQSSVTLYKEPLEFKGEDALRELETLTINAGEVQERILREILMSNGATEYLSKYMNGSTDISIFKCNVPVVMYDMIQPYIQRVANGEDSSIISGYPITEMLRSSGTSGGKPRLMPSIAEDLDRRTYLYNLILPIMNKHIPGLDKGKAMYLLFVKAEVLTPSGIPARSVLTSYYKSQHFQCRSWDPFNDYTSPDEVILCQDSHQSMYCQLLSGLIHRRHVLRLGAVFASAFLRSISFLEQHWPNLANDIRSGQLSPTITDANCRLAMSSIVASPNPDLADEIEAICGCGSWRGILGRLWPKTKYIEAVLTGTMAQYVPMLEFYSGGKIPLICTMYASSECYFGVNIRPLCDLTEVSYTLLPNMGYFEFIPLEDGVKLTDDDKVENDRVVSLVDVKLGYLYELVVTTFAGLYRYRVGDVLLVSGFHNNAPQFKFICRRNVVLSIDLDKTNEEDLHKSVTSAKKLLESQNYLLLEYTSYADTSTVPGHYVLFWEIKCTSDSTTGAAPLNALLLEDCCMAIEESLDYIYRRCRSHDKSIGPLEIRMVEGGTFDALMDLVISQGSSINQYKTPRCIESIAALELLNSKVMACFFSPHDPTWNI